jgi:hypothetical protein
MSAPIVTQIIIGARNLIADPENWTQCQLAITAAGESCDPWDKSAVKFCAYGALLKAALDLVGNDSRATVRLADSAARVLLSGGEDNGGCFSEGLFAINDYNGHGAVMELFDKVLAA